MPKKFHELSDNDYEHRVEKVDGKNIYFKSAVSKMTKQEFLNLSDKDCEFIFQCLLFADTLLKKYSNKNNLINFTTKTLDKIIDLWNDDPNQFGLTEHDFINIIGAAFGHYLNKKIGTKWLVVTDEYGTDFTCQIDEIRLRAFPLNSVSKAVHQKRIGSLEEIYLLLKQKKKELEKKL